jgi:hypothetical protein
MCAGFAGPSFLAQFVADYGYSFERPVVPATGE